MNKTIIWKPPIDIHDLALLEEMTSESNCIVSCIPEFRSGRWLDFIDDQIQFGTEYYACRNDVLGNLCQYESEPNICHSRICF